MSLRTESIRAYRALYRGAYQATTQCSLYNQTGLQQYISLRFAQSAEVHRQKLLHALRDLEEKEQRLILKAAAAAAPPPPPPSASFSESNSATTSSRQKAAVTAVKRDIAKQRRKLLRHYEGFVSDRINYTRDVAAMVPLAAGNGPLTSILQVLAAGVGNDAYQVLLHERFLTFFAHEEKRAARDEAAEEATSERQNRIMQQALLPYGERLLLVHRTTVDEGGSSAHRSSLSYLSPWQVTESIVGTRSNVTAHHLQLGRDHVVVEIDETYNKQVIYVCCTRQHDVDETPSSSASSSAEVDTGSYHWQQEVERVDVSESEEVPRTLFHAEFLVIATRLCDALVHETPLHPTRRTVITGHAVGGAVSLVLGLLLTQRGFEVSNVVTFGAPKALLGTLERYAAAVNPIRVVIAGDPLVELPVTGADGDPFVHIGEILIMNPHGAVGTADQTEKPASMSSTSPSVESRENSLEIEEPALNAESLTEFLNDTDTAMDNGDAAQRSEGLEEEEAEDDEDISELLRIAEERYKKHFLVEHYIRHLSNSAIELTYAEGDEVWDDGEYAAMRQKVSQEPYVSQEERRHRDMQGPL